MRVLFGWELGGGQAHLQFLSALAQLLHSQGVECIFALRHFNIKGNRLPGTIVSAPRLPFSGREVSHTFADILEAFGFANPSLLRSHLSEWEKLLQTIQPDLVVAEFAPGLALTTYNRVPTIVVGSGFMVPPPVEEFPILSLPAPQESFERQKRVGHTVRAVTGFNRALGELLNGDRSFVYSIPELDPYRHLRTPDQYIGVHNAPFLKPQNQKPGAVWAYLADDYSERELVLKTLRPRSEFIPLDERLDEKAMFVHHGGILTTTTCLLAGIPQLVLPRYLEQRFNALILEQLGVGKKLAQPTWEGLIMAQVHVYGMTQKAQQQAQRLSDWNQNFMDRIVNDCFNRLLA